MSEPVSVRAARAALQARKDMRRDQAHRIRTEHELQIAQRLVPTPDGLRSLFPGLRPKT